MVRLKDISEKTGYSTTTISRALNGYKDIGEDTVKKIKQVAKEMGYVVNATARNLKMNKSWTVGIIFEEHSGVGLKHPFFADILESFKKYIEDIGYDIMFLSSNKESYLSHVQEKSLDGVFVLCSMFENDQYQELAKSDVPVVVIDHLSNNIHNITSDNRDSINAVVKHLLDNGHSKIAHIFGAASTFTGLKRRNQFVKAMDEYELPVREEYFADGGIYSIEDGQRAMNDLINLSERPTAVFCAGDMLAIGAIRAIEEAGLKCPEDIAIVGFDGTELGQLITPKLTTVRQNTNKMGKIASELLVNLIDKKIDKSNETIYVETELIIGESS